MNPLQQKWEIDRVPIGSRGGSNICYKIGPMAACIYDDWRLEEAGYSAKDIALAARAIALVPAMVYLIGNIVNGNMQFDVDGYALSIIDTLYPEGDDE